MDQSINYKFKIFGYDPVAIANALDIIFIERQIASLRFDVKDKTLGGFINIVDEKLSEVIDTRKVIL